MGPIRDPHSQALLFPPSKEEQEMEKVKLLLRNLISVLPETTKKKLDPNLVKEVLGNG